MPRPAAGADMRQIRRIVIHHAAATATLEDIDRWHRARGWSGVGYHFVIEADGRVRLGRKPSEIGAHVKGHNADSIGVCVGVDARESVPNAVWSSLVSLARDLICQYGLSPNDVVGHRDLAATECPGFDVAELRDAILWLDAKPVTPPEE